MFQHVAHEILGTFHPLLKKGGFRIRYANFARQPYPDVDMRKYDGLIILGGPMGAYETDRYPHLTAEIECIRQAIETEKPVLGICLGAQLIARALGADVAPTPQKEIGWYDVSLTDFGRTDPVLGALGSPEKLFQWHADAFQIPKDAVWLASSSLCAHQAFRFREKVYAFQFHLEVDEPLVERWLTTPSNISELEALQGQIDPAQIRKETPQYIGRLKELSRRVFSKYLELFSTKRRHIVLGSAHK